MKAFRSFWIHYWILILLVWTACQRHQNPTLQTNVDKALMSFPKHWTSFAQAFDSTHQEKIEIEIEYAEEEKIWQLGITQYHQKKNWKIKDVALRGNGVYFALYQDSKEYKETIIHYTPSEQNVDLGIWVSSQKNEVWQPSKITLVPDSLLSNFSFLRLNTPHKNTNKPKPMGKWYSLVGEITSEKPIHAFVCFDDSSHTFLRGTYFYDKFYKDLQLVASTQPTILCEQPSELSHKTTGYFVFNHKEAFVGEWIDARNTQRKLPFMMQELPRNYAIQHIEGYDSVLNTYIAYPEMITKLPSQKINRERFNFNALVIKKMLQNFKKKVEKDSLRETSYHLQYDLLWADETQISVVFYETNAENIENIYCIDYSIPESKILSSQDYKEIFDKDFIAFAKQVMQAKAKLMNWEIYDYEITNFNVLGNTVRIMLHNAHDNRFVPLYVPIRENL